MDTMSFTEQINAENAKYLLSLNKDQWKTLLNASDSDGWNGETIYSNMDVYIKECQKWLKVAVKDMELHGKTKTEYKYSSTLVDCGRIYVKGFGVQRLTRELRGFLLADTGVVDLDIKNCHPCVLLSIIKNNYPELDVKKHFKYLRDYVKHRNKWLTEYNCSKVEILKAMNSAWKYKTENQYLAKLDSDFKAVQTLLWNTLEERIEIPTTILARKADFKKNKEGRFLNIILTYYENKILQEVINQDFMKLHNTSIVQTPMFDGFTIQAQYENHATEIVEALNDHTEPLGIKWVVKAHDETIIKDEGVDITFASSLTYEECKDKFEENHFIIENPLMFGKLYTLNGEEKYQFYGKEKFRDLVKPVKFFNPESSNDVEFFPYWLEDANRLSYKEIKFLPRFEHNDELFNSFKGFTYENEKVTYDEDPEVVKVFKEHLGFLSNYEEQTVDYLLKYIAHLLQKPWEVPKTAIIFKSKQGFGKDSIVDFIQTLIGKQYILRTAEMDDIFGTYNVGIRDKLVLQLNEVEGKDGFSNKEKIKNFITEEHTIIREKYISQYDQTNYMRLIILSNNINPIEITHDDRRFIVVKAHHKKPTKAYFDRLHDEFRKNDQHMQILYNYLMSIDISKFSPSGDRPITEAYKTMQEHNQNPIYKFLWNNFVNEGYKETFDDEQCKKRKNQDQIFVQSSIFYYRYKDYLSLENMGYVVPTFKIVKTILADIGITKQQKKINGHNNDYYVIDIDELRDQLSTYNLDEQIEEYNDDDFE